MAVAYSRIAMLAALFIMFWTDVLAEWHFGLTINPSCPELYSPARSPDLVSLMAEGALFLLTAIPILSARNVVLNWCCAVVFGLSTMLFVTLLRDQWSLPLNCGGMGSDSEMPDGLLLNFTILLAFYAVFSTGTSIVVTIGSAAIDLGNKFIERS